MTSRLCITGEGGIIHVSDDMINYSRLNQIGLTARPLDYHVVTDSTVESSGRFALQGA